MNGFFEDENISAPIKIKKPKNVKIGTCESCGLSNYCNSPKMGIQGKGEKKILVIIEQPGKNDDKTGKYLSGQSGNIIKEIFNEYTSLKDDCWIIAASQCYSEKEPKAAQLQTCYQKVKQTIKELKPKVIITIGKNSIDSLVQHKMTGRLTGLSLVDWVGCQIPDQEYQCYICPTWNGSYLLTDNGETNPVILSQMIYHIGSAIALCDKPFYCSNYESEAIPITDIHEVIKIIDHLAELPDPVAIDYETTGIKPHRKGHKIWYASVCDGLFSYSFPFFNIKEFRNAWQNFLESNCGKIIHNAKFEYTWTVNRAGFDDLRGYEIKNIIADTMLDAHIIHNQKHTNLKFLTYIYFGIAGYDSDIDIYLEANKEEKDKYGANAFNKIDKVPIDKMLKYNALDSLFTYKIWAMQKDLLIPEHTQLGSKFFLNSSIMLSKSENKGICLDEIQAQKEYDKLSIKMSNLEYKIQKDEVLLNWDGKEEFKPSAPANLTHLLFDIIKLKPNKDALTPTGRPSGDVDALEKYDLPIVKNVLKWRKYKKIRDTYLHSFMIEANKGIIHTSLNLHTVNTFRSSSNDPNLQNVPIRDIETMNLLRKLIISRLNHKLGEYDYKAMEAVIIACYNKDPNWIAYVSSVKNDMHRDMAARAIIRKKEEVLSDERQITKSNFVFPTVYGSYWKNTAKNMWDAFSLETKNHLKSKGIKTLEDFRSHIKRVEEWFWQDQFPVGYEWMKKTIHDYEKKGYIDLYTGFRCYGPMTRNQIINYRVQGTASHCKLWTMNQISNIIEKKKMESRILLEIHDSIIPDIDPAEEAYLDYQMWLYGTQKIREYWPWLIVPLFIEKKISKVNGNWAEMENMGLLTGEK
jgi:uracil-DNA glycosylase family 4